MVTGGAFGGLKNRPQKRPHNWLPLFGSLTCMSDFISDKLQLYLASSYSEILSDQSYKHGLAYAKELLDRRHFSCFVDWAGGSVRNLFTKFRD